MKKNKSEGLDIKKILDRLKKYWYLFIIFLFLSLSAAYFYNKYATPVYEVGAQILIFDEKENPTFNAGGVMQGFNLFNTGKKFHNELLVLQSKPIFVAAVKNLDHRITYYEDRIMFDRENYKTSPFVVSFDENHPQPVGVRFHIEFISDTQVALTAEKEQVGIYNFAEDKLMYIEPKFEIENTYALGEDVAGENFRFKIILNKTMEMDEILDKSYYFVFNNTDDLVRYYSSAIEIFPVKEEANVASIILKHENPNKAVDVINNLTKEYLDANLEKKNHISKTTIDFIDDQLNDISDSLNFTEKQLQDFRTSNQVMDVSVKAGRVYERLQELQEKKAALVVDSKYYRYIDDYFDQNKDISDMLAPSSMGIEDPLLNNLIKELTQLNAEKTTLIENNQGKSPYLKKINIQIENLKNTIRENINYILNTSEIAIRDIDQRLAELNSEINQLPRTERELFGIERKFKINDAIYTYLLQKRSEAQITHASNLPDSEVIEEAHVLGTGPIKPSKTRNYLLAVFLGLLLPIGIIQVREQLDDRIRDRQEVEEYVEKPIIGNVYHNRYRDNMVIASHPNSAIAESFRSVRANMQYFTEEKRGTKILVTSTIEKEGKSFISTNLAYTMALANKYTILISFDMRKANLYEKLNMESPSVGLSNYLSKRANMEDIIINTNQPNLDFIPAGPIPPNPSELIGSERTSKLIESLEPVYDYIILDTPPIGLVSDTYMLMDKADLNVYIVRENYTPKREFQFAINDLGNKKINNLTFIMNDVRYNSTRRYGSGYYDEK